MILAEMPATYKPYILANSQAQASGTKAFVVTTYAEEVSYLSRPYPELSRHMLVNRIANQTNAEERLNRPRLAGRGRAGRMFSLSFHHLARSVLKEEFPVPKKKMLVAGASGLVGYAAVEHFASRTTGTWLGFHAVSLTDSTGAEVISVDLTDTARCAEVFGRMSDVTHLIYAALYEKPGLVEGWFQKDQMETNLAMLDNLFSPLEAVAQDLQHVSLLQGTKAYGVHIEPFPVPARERWPRHQHENFYFLQEDYLRERQPGKNWHWTVWRPQLILGQSLGSNMNVIPALGVYAALGREAGLPLSFPVVRLLLSRRLMLA